MRVSALSLGPQSSTKTANDNGKATFFDCGSCNSQNWAYLMEVYDLVIGEVSEWSKVQHWKCCVRKRTQGSNPCLSAIFT